MNLIAEEDRAALHRAAARLGFLDDLAYARDTLGHGTELDECCVRALGDDARDGRLASAGRTPEDDAADRVALDQLTQSAAGREQVLLPDILVECARPHACGEGCAGDGTVGAAGVGRRVVASLEQIELTHALRYTPAQWPCPTSSDVSQYAATPMNTPACTRQS